MRENVIPAADDREYCFIHLVRNANGHGVRVLVEFPEDPESDREYGIYALAKADVWLLSEGWVSTTPPKEVTEFMQAGFVLDLANYYFYQRTRRIRRR
ncbi:MAG: hypothetical protein ACYC6L_12670 [Anaerolineae bacterium]